ncbi:MAG: hypothetical protein HOB84_07375 [Candidatus Marinimicrobia bacterium]|jgi:hypothetical protein|nr:hypothetical protein [Candidatus Neomarinimicrobiota bacterium]MBT4360359.1 hypothetical protein [Candidatus Neomarinimicrobiota bacterium]MBT4714576.1 hypothetical protein [Candidatus Neomarinimicrobiota bacterium]MBT4946615.1 hypothetical protein [Candidatus Neomarinimicrobiota bacterium]MBT5270306.1 hypothetical protein [Candidatus Neomarinimicrobiota bacterium]
MKYWGLFILLPCLLLAQPEFFGYFESEASTMQIGTSNYNYGFNKFRLDVEARPNDHILIGANITAQQYWGQTTWNMLDFIPEEIWTPFFPPDPLSSQAYSPAFPITIPDTLFLDNVYMKISLSSLDVTVGRQQISKGVGYAWNPTDIFNSKSLLDPSYEQTGVEGLRFDYTLAYTASVSVFIQPEQEWEQSAKQGWLKVNLGSFDIELTKASHNWGYPTFLTGPYLQNRSLLGASVVGEVLGFGTWFEGSSFQTDSPLATGGDEEWKEFIVGVDYTFENSLYILGEYLHNDLGVADKSELTLWDYLGALDGASHSLMQDYAFFYAMHPTFDFVTLSAIAFTNFNDNSGAFSPIVDWNILQDANLSVQGSFFWGEDDTEFGLQDWGLTLTATSSF